MDIQANFGRRLGGKHAHIYELCDTCGRQCDFEELRN